MVEKTTIAMVLVSLLLGSGMGYVANDVVDPIDTDAEPNKPKPKPPESWTDPVRISNLVIQDRTDGSHKVLMSVVDVDGETTKCTCNFILMSNGSVIINRDLDPSYFLRTSALGSPEIFQYKESFDAYVGDYVIGNLTLSNGKILTQQADA